MRVNRKINLSEPIQRALLVQEIMTASGPHTVEISPARAKASQQQHGYYRGVVLPIAKFWLNETQGGDEWGGDFDEDSTHEWLKIYLRGKPVVNRKTGEQIGMAAVSHALYSTKDMVDFVDDVIDLLNRNDQVVPPPDKNHNQQPTTVGGKR